MELQEIINDLIQKGYTNATADYYGNKLFNEQYGADKDKYTNEERSWAYAHGFTAEEVKILHINEDNFKNYVGGGYITSLIRLIQ